MECPRCRAQNPDSADSCASCSAPLRDPGSPGGQAPGPAAASPRPGSHPPSRPLDSDDSSSLTTTIDPIGRGLAPGVVVAGKYRLLGEIGRGGMGIVYEADDLKLRRAVALKFLPLDYTDDAEARERFVHEAQAASVLDSPHICTIHEIGESAGGHMFIAMALCHGESLRAKIKRGPLAAAEALSLAAQVSDGLAAAHAAGIVHRDVKPGNILVSHDGLAKIADFGLAKIAGEARLTRAGRAVGTVAYMAPEQLRGEDVDARADVWSLGVVLYEMLTGALPFHGTNEHSLAYAIVNGEPKPLTDLPSGTPAGCDAVLARALAKEPDGRFSTAAAMSEAIAAVRDGSGLTGARGPGTGGRGSGVSPSPSGSASASPSASAAASAEAPTAPAAPERRVRAAAVRFGLPVLAAGLAIYAAVAAGLPGKIGALLGLGEPPGAGRRITVFSPSVVAGAPEDGVLAAGLAEYLRRALDAIAGRARSWVTPEDHTVGHGVHEAADAYRVLGSNRVLSGTFKRSGDTLTLTLEVVDPARLTRLASVPKSDSVANIATWQEDLVLEAAAALGLAAPPTARAALAASGTTVPRAFHAYLIGLGYMSAPQTAPPGADPADAAVASLELAVGLDPSFGAAGIDLADAYRQRSKPAGDLSWTRKAEAQARAVLATNSGMSRGHLALAAALRRLGRDDEALAALERARALDPLDYDTLIRLGTIHEENNRPVEAEAAYREALRLRPDYWAARSHLGYFYVVRGEYAKARDQFEAVTRLCPGNFYALNNLGACHFKLGDAARATAAFERSNAVKKNADAFSNLGVLYYYAGRYADSVMANENAIALGASDFGYLIWGNLADAYRFTPGQEAKALEAYAKAIALVEEELAADPSEPRKRSSLAIYLAKAGETARAVDVIQGAVEALPDDSSVVLKAAVVFELAGERARALEAIGRFARLNGPLDEVGREPYLATLRQDPGYAEIVTGKAGGRRAAASR